MVSKEIIAAQLMELQDSICQHLAAYDGQAFHEDLWDRPEGGGGRTRVLQGNRIEKGGVLFSAVHGPLPETQARSMGLSDTDFFATGVSIVLHPHSPMAPIIHMNVRYFETLGGERWWFGGGIDLTPHYVVPEDARYFHQQLQSMCNDFDPSFYPKFKEQADDYFYIRHRQETRGVGGIFYDYLDDTNTNLTKQQLFDFILATGRLFAPTYLELLRRSEPRSFGSEQKKWQHLRRGRYVEFNLVWDRGTKFGLETNGRTESILMSMPPAAHWEYNQQPAPNSPEAQTLQHLRKGIDWLSL